MNKSEFVERVRKCERRLYRVARTLLSSNADCEDAVQEALLKAWLSLGNLREERYFETWLIRILINECRSLYRRRAAREVQMPENIHIVAEDASSLMEAMDGLPEKNRIVLELHYIEGYKTREVARMLRIPESTVKWRLVKGRKELKNLLGEEEPK